MLGREIPEHFNVPEFDEVESHYWSAFWDLSTERQLGAAGAGPIPWSAINAYTMNYGTLQKNIFKNVIRGMDAAYLSDDKKTMSGVLTPNQLRG